MARICGLISLFICLTLLSLIVVNGAPTKTWQVAPNAWGPPYCNENWRYGGAQICSSVGNQVLTGKDCSAYKTGLVVKTGYVTGFNFKCTEIGGMPQVPGKITPSSPVFTTLKENQTVNLSSIVKDTNNPIYIMQVGIDVDVTKLPQPTSGHRIKIITNGSGNSPESIQTLFFNGQQIKQFPAYFANPTPGQKVTLTAQVTDGFDKPLPGFNIGSVSIKISAPAISSQKTWQPALNGWGPPYCNENWRYSGAQICSSVGNQVLTGKDCSAYKTGLVVKTAYVEGYNFKCTESANPPVTPVASCPSYAYASCKIGVDCDTWNIDLRVDSINLTSGAVALKNGTSLIPGAKIKPSATIPISVFDTGKGIAALSFTVNLSVNGRQIQAKIISNNDFLIKEAPCKGSFGAPKAVVMFDEFSAPTGAANVKIEAVAPAWIVEKRKEAAKTISPATDNNAKLMTIQVGCTVNSCTGGQECDITTGLCKEIRNCTDNIQNQDESDIDCGGKTCPKCADNKACKSGTDCQGGYCIFLQAINSKFTICSNRDYFQPRLGTCKETCADIDGCTCPKECKQDPRLIIQKGRQCIPDIGCYDNIKNQDEGDIDCGGPCQNKCLLGRTCRTASDCESGFCVGVEERFDRFCVETDRKKTVLTNCQASCTDIDGCICPLTCSRYLLYSINETCGKTNLGAPCSTAMDCASGFCINKLCSKTDGIKETVKDCSSQCSDEDGCYCKSDAVFISGSNGSLQPGGGQSKCANPGPIQYQQTCGGNPPTCSDGKKNQLEGDVDCGGPCEEKCATEKSCISTADCASGACFSGICTDAIKTQLTSCTDPCNDGDGCTCPRFCNNNGAIAKTSSCGGIILMCNNKIKDTLEDDIDCGGQICPPCQDGKACWNPSYCQSGSCIDGRCGRLPPSDGQQTVLSDCVIFCRDLDGCTCPSNCEHTTAANDYTCYGYKPVTPACTPKRCAELGKSCGSWPDGCGAYVNCGTCVSGTCDATGKCTTPTCTPKTCQALSKICGSWPDGCGGTVRCPDCAAGQNCHTNGQCQQFCTPLTCQGLGKNCGKWPDYDCGLYLDCGNCQTGQTCDDYGACVTQCVPMTCPQIGKECGTWADGCGKNITCGSCAAGKACSAQGTCLPECKTEDFTQPECLTSCGLLARKVEGIIKSPYECAGGTPPSIQCPRTAVCPRPQGQGICGDTPVNAWFDDQNCGGCNVKCPTNQQCILGKCSDSKQTKVALTISKNLEIDLADYYIFPGVPPNTGRTVYGGYRLEVQDAQGKTLVKSEFALRQFPTGTPQELIDLYDKIPYDFYLPYQPLAAKVVVYDPHNKLVYQSPITGEVQ